MSHEKGKKNREKQKSSHFKQTKQVNKTILKVIFFSFLKKQKNKDFIHESWPHDLDPPLHFRLRTTKNQRAKL